MMKFEVLAALLLFLIKETKAQVGSAQCKGKIVDVFVESSYLSAGDSLLDPDTHVQLTVGDETSTSRVVEDEKYATFNEWLSFRNVLSGELSVEVWNRGQTRDDHLVGQCCIKLNKNISEEKCCFDGGEVSLIYVCT